MELIPRPLLFVREGEKGVELMTVNYRNRIFMYD